MSELVANQVIERCGSTNDLARQLGEAGYPHGTWISAREQEKGRGRLGRQWQSLQGNLFLSLVARPERRDLWTWVPMATAIAIAEAANEKFPGLGIRVKWPNDLWIEKKKLGGILCEAVGGRDDSFIVIGIGINCAVAPEGLDQATTSLSQEISGRVVADDVRTEIIGSVLKWMSLDPSRLAAEYNRLAALPEGTSIQWADGTKSGVIEGLGPAGELRVLVAAGERISLYAEDVKIRPL